MIYILQMFYNTQIIDISWRVTATEHLNLVTAHGIDIKQTSDKLTTESIVFCVDNPQPGHKTHYTIQLPPHRHSDGVVGAIDQHSMWVPFVVCGHRTLE